MKVSNNESLFPLDLGRNAYLIVNNNGIYVRLLGYDIKVDEEVLNILCIFAKKGVVTFPFDIQLQPEPFLVRITNNGCDADEFIFCILRNGVPLEIKIDARFYLNSRSDTKDSLIGSQTLMSIIPLNVTDTIEKMVDEFENSKKKAFEKQIGGNHYKGGIDPYIYALTHSMEFAEGCIVKYITRYKEKGGKEDLLKIIDYTEKLIEAHYPEGEKEWYMNHRK